MLPNDIRNSQRAKELADWSCATTMHIVEINAQPIVGETNARDYDFSRAAIERRWQTGYADASRMLQQRPWDDPVDPVTQITVYESDAST
jgi:NTE family protein